MRLWLLALLLGLVPHTAHAADPTKTLEAARRLFDAARYQESLPLFDELEANTSLPRPTRVETLKLHAYALYMVSLHDEAKLTWLELLQLEPSFKLDPDLESPIFVSFFSRLQPVPREAPREPPAETGTVEPPPATSSPSATTGCGVALCLVPFGVGQFANEQPVKGVVLGALEVIFLGTNFAIQLQRNSAYEAAGNRVDDPAAERRAVLMQNVALGLFVTTAVFGVVDAFLSDGS